MRLKELTAKSLLHFHEQTFATNWDANIYRGCGHNCVYCFAQYSHRYFEDASFFQDVFVKKNAAEILYKELAKPRWEKHPVNLSGVSDCYQPVEKKCLIIPEVIEAFTKNRNPLVIVTKSTLPLRDIKLLEELNSVAEVTIMASVSTIDEKIRKLTEPNAAPTVERIEMLGKFAELGFKTAVLFMPILPFLTDNESNLDEIFRLTSLFGVGSIEVWPLHLRGETKGVFFAFLDKHFPDLLPLYRKLYATGSVSKDYKLKLNQRVLGFRKKYSLFDSYKQSKPAAPNGHQLELF